MQSNKKITDKRRFSVVMKITAIVIVMAILIGSTAIYAGYYLHSTTMNQYYKNQVVNISKTLSKYIPADYIEQLKEAASDPELETVREEAIASDNPDLVKDWMIQKGVYDDYEKVLSILEDFRNNMGMTYVYVLNNQANYSTYLADPDEDMTVIHHKEIIEVAANFFGRCHGCIYIKFLTVRKRREYAWKHGRLNLCGNIQFRTNAFFFRSNSGNILNILIDVCFHLTNRIIKVADLIIGLDGEI